MPPSWILPINYGTALYIVCLMVFNDTFNNISVDLIHSPHEKCLNTFQQLLILSNFKHFLSWNDGYFALLVNIKKHTLNKGRRCRDLMVIVFTTTL
jgi:hypothetical protein